MMPIGHGKKAFTNKIRSCYGKVNVCSGSFRANNANHQKEAAMWKTILIVPFIFLFISFAPLSAAEPHGAQLTFAADGHDCGEIYFEEVDVKTVAIEFSNTGNAPLVLANVRACCGTRVIEWPHEPVLPGENATIEVRFRVPNRPHMIRRVVTVQSNSINDPRKQFSITGQAIQKTK